MSELIFLSLFFIHFFTFLDLFDFSSKVEPRHRASSFSRLAKTPRARAWKRAEPKLVPPLRKSEAAPREEEKRARDGVGVGVQDQVLVGHPRRRSHQRSLQTSTLPHVPSCRWPSTARSASATTMTVSLPREPDVSARGRRNTAGAASFFLLLFILFLVPKLSYVRNLVSQNSFG